MIRVCDALMGTGKSSAAITYINEHPERRFIYITPYLSEAQRISDACAGTMFYTPKKKNECRWSKVVHTIELIRDGVNVSTTHQAFTHYPTELIDLIKEQHYTLIVDENVDTLECIDQTPADIDIAVASEYMTEVSPGVFSRTDKPYDGKIFCNLFRIASTRDIIMTDRHLYYWELPPSLISAFDDVFILTYMFKGQGLYYSLKMYDIPYEYIGVSKKDGVYRFSDHMEYVPEYTARLADMIHIYERENLNSIGEKRTALSVAWFDKHSEDVHQLKNNVYNYFKRISSTDRNKRMWSTFGKVRKHVSGDGYARRFKEFNARASNEMRDRDTLAYCVNVFMNVGQKQFYLSRGIEIDEDAYALSTMVQWIWRSAIRDGKEINIYIPSSRMRNLLKNWIKNLGELSNGGTHDE